MDNIRNNTAGAGPEEKDLDSTQYLYIMSGDPTYITNYMGARSLIMKVERDELVEEIMESYIRTNHWA